MKGFRIIFGNYKKIIVKTEIRLRLELSKIDFWNGKDQFLDSKVPKKYSDDI